MKSAIEIIQALLKEFKNEYNTWNEKSAIEHAEQFLSHPQEVEAGGIERMAEERYPANGRDENNNRDYSCYDKREGLIAGYKAASHVKDTDVPDIPAPAAVEEGKELVTMDIYAEPGTMVTPEFKDGKPVNGYEGDKAKVLKHLKEGEWYTVKSIDVGNWSSSVILKEIPNVYFNTVSFLQKSPPPSSSITEGKEVDSEKTLWDIHAHFKWTFENMGTEHTADHFNIPANGLQMLEEFIAGYTSVQKEENKNY